MNTHSNPDQYDGRYDFSGKLKEHGLEIKSLSVETLMMNITRLCNQACSHCHVDASPQRTEQMSLETINRCLEILAQHEVRHNLDITGGAPELNPHFEYLVTEARKLGKHVSVRHNLTVIFDGDPQTGGNRQYLPEFFAENQVEVIASLPYFEQSTTDRIRGQGVFEKSIEGLRLLNSQGYGIDSDRLTLDLVHNCDGPLLPSDRDSLEMKYKHELAANYGITFDRLFTVTNMPINRFRASLIRSGSHEEYMDALVSAFDPSATQGLVCRSLVSIDPDGCVYDCDFNQILGIQIRQESPATVFNLDFDALANRKIMFGPHCFGCTAGGGSS
jgi:radical SAM/Cys-rich protein